MLASLSVSTLGAVTADDDFDIAWPYKGDWVLESAYVTPDGTLAADATNYIAVIVKTNDGAGGAFTSCGSFDTDASADNVSLAAGTSQAITLSGAGCTIDQGDIVRLSIDETGTVSPGVSVNLTVVARKLPT